LLRRDIYISLQLILSLLTGKLLSFVQLLLQLSSLINAEINLCRLNETYYLSVNVIISLK